MYCGGGWTALLIIAGSAGCHPRIGQLKGHFVSGAVGNGDQDESRASLTPKCCYRVGTKHSQPKTSPSCRLSSAHAIRAGLLPLHHRDPFDRMLAAQAQVTGWPIISADRVFDYYGVRRIW